MNKLLLLVAVTGVLCSRTKSQSPPGNDFPIVAYYICHSSPLSEINFKQFTHLHYAFLNPDSTGELILGTDCLDSLVPLAHANKVKILGSIGGGSAPEYYSALLKDGKRQQLITKLVEVVERYQLDGIDVDLEGKRIDENYEAFVTELKAALSSRYKLVTAAIATVYKMQLTDKALSQFDYITIMSYDKTGPWNPNIAGHHSPYSMAVEDTDYWVNTRQLNKDKLYLGLPFYGYSFGPAGAGSFAYKDIIGQFPGAENKDELTMPDGSILYYNGIPTIRKKVQLAKDKLGGVMFWQLMGDSKDDKSLLKAINEEAKQ